MSEDFYEKHSDLECVFYDRDIKKLSRAFDDCEKIFKSIKKRVERKDSVKVAKSTFDFYCRQDLVSSCPQNVYNFHDDITCIALEFNSKEHRYEVHTYGWNLPKSEFYDRYSSNCGLCSNQLTHGITAFRMAVKQYILEKNHELL